MSQQPSETQSPSPPRRSISRAAVVTHGRPEQIGDAVARLESVAARCGVELVSDDEAELVVVLGGDGAILATSTGSTAYNLSAGGPVIAWGIDAFVVSFVSPHSLHARSMVLGRPHHVELRNASPDVPLHAIVDGHRQGDLAPGKRVTVGLGDRSARLARVPGTSFFSRYRETFSH